MCVRVCVCEGTCVRVCVCEGVCVRVCVCEGVCMRGGFSHIAVIAMLHSDYEGCCIPVSGTTVRNWLSGHMTHHMSCG